MSSQPNHPGNKVNPVTAAFRSTKSAWIHVAVFSTAVNFLMLTGSIYMLQVYDRVLSSRSIATLVGITVIALLAFALQGVMDAMRLKVLGRIGASVDEQLSPMTARAAVVFPLKGASPAEAMQPMRDLDAVRGFLSSAGPTALIDMPFMPLFIAACFLLHPWLGLLTVFGGLLIVLLTLYIERVSKEPTLALTRSAAERAMLAEAGRRNAEAIAGLGMAGTFARRFDKVHSGHVNDGLVLSDSASGIGSFAKVLRYALQSAVLGLGAYLAVRGELSAGAMIAASILTTRALAPIEIAVAHWKSFVAARQGFARLKQRLPLLVTSEKTLDLPAPKMMLKVDDLSVVAPQTQKPIVQGVTFAMKAGDAVGLVGPSGSGKSTLARTLVGAWLPARGTIRLDGALIEQWDRDVLGRSLGYLPQDVELFDGTIAENIARFSENFSSEAVLKAAEVSGAHPLITGFPDGYETRIGEGGAKLSGGQRQRIALARALYGDPFMVVLDEPNASLDTSGDEALNKAIRSVRERNGIVVVITHRPSGLASVNLVGAMADGRMIEFGPRDQVLQKIMKQGGMPAIRRPVESARVSEDNAGSSENRRGVVS
jgi:ATP-binding cassette, subfamily C, bacterial PrsD